MELKKSNLKREKDLELTSNSISIKKTFESSERTLIEMAKGIERDIELRRNSLIFL